MLEIEETRYFQNKYDKYWNIIQKKNFLTLGNPKNIALFSFIFYNYYISIKTSLITCVLHKIDQSCAKLHEVIYLISVQIGSVRTFGYELGFINCTLYTQYKTNQRMIVNNLVTVADLYFILCSLLYVKKYSGYKIHVCA